MERSFSTTNAISQEKEHNILSTPPNDHHVSCDDLHQTLITSQIVNFPIPSTCISEEYSSQKKVIDRQDKGLGDESSASNLKKRKEVSVGGGIVIPERWGQEALLKDWVDYSTFDALLAPAGVGIAREALVAEARARGRSRGMRQLAV